MTTQLIGHLTTMNGLHATFRMWRKSRVPFLPSMDPNIALSSAKIMVRMTVHILPITPCDSVSVLVSCGEVYFRIRHCKALWHDQDAQIHLG